MPRRTGATMPSNNVGTSQPVAGGNNSVAQTQNNPAVGGGVSIAGTTNGNGHHGTNGAHHANGIAASMAAMTLGGNSMSVTSGPTTQVAAPAGPSNGHQTSTSAFVAPSGPNVLANPFVNGNGNGHFTATNNTIGGPAPGGFSAAAHAVPWHPVIPVGAPMAMFHNGHAVVPGQNVSMPHGYAYGAHPGWRRHQPVTPRVTMHVPTPGAPLPQMYGPVNRVNNNVVEASEALALGPATPTRPGRNMMLSPVASRLGSPLNVGQETVGSSAGNHDVIVLVKIENPCPPGLVPAKIPHVGPVAPSGTTRFVSLIIEQERVEELEHELQMYFSSMRNSFIRESTRSRDDYTNLYELRWCISFDDNRDAEGIAEWMRRKFGHVCQRFPLKFDEESGSDVYDTDITMDGMVCFTIKAENNAIVEKYIEKDLMARLHAGSLVRGSWSQDFVRPNTFELVVDFYSLKQAEWFLGAYANFTRCVFDGEPRHVVSVKTKSWVGVVLEFQRMARDRVPRGPHGARNALSGHRNAVKLYAIISGSDVRTTVMIRNIDYEVTYAELKNWLDVRCKGWYDFLYLRMDFRSGCNVGYAFVNFIDAKHIAKVLGHIGMYPAIAQASNGHPRPVELSYATIQGREALIQKFRNSSVMTKQDEYRPKLLFAYPLEEFEGVYPYCEWIGLEQPFPECDNPTKMLRSRQNQETYGLYHRVGPRGSHVAPNTSSFDNGSPQALLHVQQMMHGNGNNQDHGDDQDNADGNQESHNGGPVRRGVPDPRHIIRHYDAGYGIYADPYAGASNGFDA